MKSESWFDINDVGEGVFHQWLSADSSTLWVNSDVDNVTAAIDTDSLKVVAEIAMPSDLTNGKPHDVFVDPLGDAVFVSYVGVDGGSDYVVRFDTATLEETHRAAVGQDPHLFASTSQNKLYVATQGTNEVYFLSRDTLEACSGPIAVPGAHGIVMSPIHNLLYTTNLPGEGDDAIYTTDLVFEKTLPNAEVNLTNVGKPHNIAVTDDGKKLYVTHSGPDANRVSILVTERDSGLPWSLDNVEVGTNPFGIAIVP